MAAMADSKDMLAVKTVLLKTQGATGEMLAAGLSHALEGCRADRHELQVGLLKMLKEVLSTAQTTAKVEAEENCQRKVKTAEAQLEACKTVVASATEVLAEMQAGATAKKEKLGECRRQVVLEEAEHKRVEALDEEKAKEVTVHEQGKAEVVGLLEAMAQKDSGEIILNYLRTINADPILVAGLRSVLDKEPSERCGFDLVALEHLQSILKSKIAEWEAQIEATICGKVNIHAEALGAWAVKELAGQHVHEATVKLESVEAAVASAHQTLKEAMGAYKEQERILAQCLTELTLASERARQCGNALEALERLEAGQEVVLETSPQAMEVDAEMNAAKMDAVMATESVTPIMA